MVGSVALGGEETGMRPALHGLIVEPDLWQLNDVGDPRVCSYYILIYDVSFRHS